MRGMCVGVVAAADQLRGTPTLVIAPSTLASFGANDFPFLIATDHDGIIRLLLPAARKMRSSSEAPSTRSQRTSPRNGRPPLSHDDFHGLLWKRVSEDHSHRDGPSLRTGTTCPRWRLFVQVERHPLEISKRYGFTR